jgi:hypothetical protein
LHSGAGLTRDGHWVNEEASRKPMDLPFMRRILLTVPGLIVSWPLVGAEPERIPNDRYACAAACAALASSYLGAASGEGLFTELDVAADGTATVGRLQTYLRQRGLQCEVYEETAPWYIRAYLSRPDCCVVAILSAARGRERHAVALFPGRAGTVVMSDLLARPKIVNDKYLAACTTKGSFLVVISRDRLAAPIALHVRRLGPAYVGAMVLLGIVTALILRRRASHGARSAIT